MVTQTTKVKNGTIVLPREIRKAWERAEILVSGGKETILIKKVSIPSLSQMLDEFRKIGKKIKKEDVKEAIEWARRKTYKK